MEPFDGKRVMLWVNMRALETGGAPSAWADAVADALVRRGCRVEPVSSSAQLAMLLERGAADLVVTRVGNSCREPLELLSRFHARPAAAQNLPPVILLATALDVQAYLEGMRKGAFDCVALPFEEKEFIRVAARALEATAVHTAA